MSLTSKTLDIIKHFEFKFNKNLGQNFLIDENILNKIIDGAELDHDDCALEIGPGIGTLTQAMAKRCKRVIAIEIDDSLIDILNETLGNYENIKIIHGDALKMDFKKLIEDEGLDNVKIVANLPYYLTTPFITNILSQKTNIKSLTLMIQKEVADRITAKCGSSDYSSLSLLCTYFCDIHKIARVSKNCFIPKPKVESAVIRMDVKKEPSIKVIDEDLLFRVIRFAFNMRRKTLWNALKPLGLGEDKLKCAFEKSGIDPVRRGETLSLEEFGRLSDEIKGLI
ncbi:16S rRNA (adenine(1518)-N(6)/adenine(1519)-N(6))-dimethyltransferase RsmA [Caloramator sp. E03]|uniref:16S rRNA (adenine(1518)-N(6)/adenine(1519)-N(6))- dimethyltransferase RsmA n=1 Tax=Caloramator sp. E03 TaxID=2576307 RepID=UPI0011103C5D|nr:16S rRNA (adenine(1518)-N(6)/adenine(1519)-N(6))-dimethyltransferase RsmA [Caloramator sp. E03]QCX33459.1 16S rRNA (adenine(1518)-N(6)/adenine(1519)-N(6))-dimethyltransferase RsmA [Caloramator sp. E03]